MTNPAAVEFTRNYLAQGVRYEVVDIMMKFKLSPDEALNVLVEARKPAQTPIEEIAPAPSVETENWDELDQNHVPEVFDPLPNVPEEMKQLSQWLTWNGDVTKGKQPFQSGTQIPARTDVQGHLVDYQTAAKNIQAGKGYKHLGFVPTGDILGLDIDVCRDPKTGEIAPWANQLLAALPPTYTEVTPSQTGLRPWLRVPGLDRRKIIYPVDDGVTRVPGDKAPQVELLTRNYGTVTGVSANHARVLATITLEQWAAIEQLLATWKPKNVSANGDRKIISGLVESYGVEVDGPGIPRGKHDNTLFAIGCSLRARGWDQPEVEERLILIADVRCESRGPDYVQMAKKCAIQACKYPAGIPSSETVIMSQTEATRAAQEAIPVQPLVTELTLNDAQKMVDAANEKLIANWRNEFRNISQMDQGNMVMIIDGVLQEGVAFIGASAGDGKTLVALSMAKAIVLGQPLFGIAEYKVPAPQNVIYLIPESSDKPFRDRCHAFKLPEDDRFLTRTISSGLPLSLDNPLLLEAVRQTKAVVFLDTVSRFITSEDENSAAQNRVLVDNIIALRAAGSPCVVVLHHAKKSGKEKGEAMTLENMLRGTGDYAAMCDTVYGVRADDRLRANGSGPLEMDIVNLKDREQVGGLSKLRLAASYTKGGSLFPVSYINETGNLKPVDYKQTVERIEATLIQIVEADPKIPTTDIMAQTGLTRRKVTAALEGRGWHIVKGGTDGHSPWHQDKGVPCPFDPHMKAANAKKGIKAEKPDTEQAVA
jgi:hypothetical protein